MIGLNQRAVVYLPDAVTGRFTTVGHADLPCRLAHIGRQPAATGAERVELAALRNLIWSPEYDMPEGAQVLVDGARYNVVAGTVGALRGPTGAVLYRRCDATRAVNA